jgi:glutathione S-transferase
MLKLHWSPRSPFVRKVMVALHETGLTDRVECVRTQVAMDAPNAELMRDNPLSKLPTLILEDGTALFDSRVICEYLDGMHDGVKLFPADPAARFQALRWQALGDGLLDLLILWRYERARAPEARSTANLVAFTAKAAVTVARLETEAAALTAAPYGIGHVSIGVVLAYLDFRYPDFPWRKGRPYIAQWFETIAARPSMVATNAVDDSAGG